MAAKEHIVKYNVEHGDYRSPEIFVREGGTFPELIIDEETYETALQAYIDDGMPRDEAVATVRKPDVWEQVLLRRN